MDGTTKLDSVEDCYFRMPACWSLSHGFSLAPWKNSAVTIKGENPQLKWTVLSCDKTDVFVTAHVWSGGGGKSQFQHF